MTETQKRPAVAGPGARNTNSPSQYTPADRLLPLLGAVKTTGPGRWIARCPAHPDKDPSLSIRETGDGTLLLKCWAGCGAADVVTALGLALHDLFPSRREGRGPLRRGERWIPADVLRCVSREALVALVAAEAVRRGDVLSDEDMQRLALAAQRLRDAAGEASHG